MVWGGGKGCSLFWAQFKYVSVVEIIWRVSHFRRIKKIAGTVVVVFLRRGKKCRYVYWLKKRKKCRYKCIDYCYKSQRVVELKKLQTFHKLERVFYIPALYLAVLRQCLGFSWFISYWLSFWLPVLHLSKTLKGVQCE